MMLNLPAEKREFNFKVLVVGDIGTGKTSIIRRYVHQLFSIHYKSTIGADFAMKVIEWDENTQIRLQLWDIAGQERFGNMTRVYYKDAAGVFVVFDVTRSSTFEAIERWKSDLDSKVFLQDGSTLPAVLLANKCDQESLFDADKIEKLCSEKGFVGWFQTSAKENRGIDEAIRFLLKKILESQSDQERSTTSTDREVITPSPAAPEPDSCCLYHHKKNRSPTHNS